MSAHQISRTHRALLTGAGLCSWLAGGAASFLGSNGPGAAALIVAGVLCGVLGLMGHWPSRIALSGNEATWETVELAVSTQIQAAVRNDEGEPVLAELRSLQDRLAELQRTGVVPKHPAELYDDAVVAAIHRLLPEAEIIRQEARDQAIADFIVRYRGSTLFVETKWRADPARAFRGSTLHLLTARLPADARLLVVTNTIAPPLAVAYGTMERAMGDRGRIVQWLGPADDSCLAETLAALLAGPKCTPNGG